MPALPGLPVAPPAPPVPVLRALRRLCGDLTLVALALVIGGICVGVGLDRTPAPPDALVGADVLAGSVLCLLLGLRRRWAVPLALLAATVGAWSDMATGAGLVLLFTVAAHRRWPWAAGVAGAQAVASLVYFRVRPDHDVPYPASIAVVWLLLAAVVGWGLLVRARRELVDSLRDRALRAEREQQWRVAQAAEAERTRIAREMHDVLAHRLSLLSLHAGALEFRPQATPAEVEAAAGVVRACAHQALQDLREVIGVLRAGPVEAAGAPQPTLLDLPGLLDESRRAGVRVRDEVRLTDVGAVPTALGRHAYRVVQEGLTNARRHAPGAPVDVELEGRPGGELVVRVRNGARTRSPSPVAGQGAGLLDCASGSPCAAAPSRPAATVTATA